MITIKEIAERAGVSRRTVDRVIYNRGDVNPDTRALIEQIMKENDFVPNQAARGLAARKKKFRLAFSTISESFSPIYKVILDGAKKKAKELEAYGVSVEYYIFDWEQRMDPEELEKCIQEFNCDALAVIPGEIPEIKSLIHRAEELHIPIIYYNIDSDLGERMCYVGCDYRKAGRMAAGMTGLSIENEGKAAVVAFPGISRYSYEERVAGFEEELKKNYPRVDVVDYIQLLQRDQGEQEVQRLHEEHPELKAIYLINPVDYNLFRIIREIMPEGVRIITNNLVEPDILGSGAIDVTITQDPQSQGSLSLQLLFDYLVYGQIPETRKIYTNLAINIRESI